MILVALVFAIDYCSIKTDIHNQATDTVHEVKTQIQDFALDVIDDILPESKVPESETISSEKERLSLYLKTRSVAIVIDESTKIKNPDAKLAKDFFELSSLFKIRVIMTGTPVANRPYDIWSQIYFLDEGKSLGTDFKEFSKSTDLRNDLGSNDEKREDFETCVSEIFSKISKFTVRETKNSGIISLPNKIYHDEICEFEIVQKLLQREDIETIYNAGDSRT